MPKPLKIKIDDQDFKDLINLINNAYSTAANEYFAPQRVDSNKILNNLKNKSDQERYDTFSELVDLYPKAWEFDGYYANSKLTKQQNDEEFMRKTDAVLPAEIRNSGDPTVLENYYLENSKKPNKNSKNNNKLSIKAKARIIKRLNVIDKREKNISEAAKRANGEEPFNRRPQLKVNGQVVEDYSKLSEEQKNGRIVLDVHMPKKQTTGNGCWSCGMQMLLQGRGITNVTQEDIRSYRPNYGKQMLKGEKFTKQHVIDKAYNMDGMQNIMDMGDAAVNLAPDSMLRTLDILNLGEAEDALYRKLSQDEKNAYIKNAQELVKKTIRKVLLETKSPISISNGTHYITIVGIDGDKMLTKSSTSRTYDTPEEKDINTYVRGIITGRFKFQLVWMEDIQLSQDRKHFYNVPSNSLELNEDGTYKMPPTVIKDEARSMKAEQEYEGFRVRLYAGKEDTRNDRAERALGDGKDLLVDGVIKIEQAYMPKKINRANLVGMADKRSKEQEELLKSQAKNLLGYDPTVGPKQKKKVKTDDDYILRPKGLEKDFVEHSKPEELKKQYNDDLIAGKDDKKSSRIVEKDEKVNDRLFDKFNLAAGKEKDVQIKERNETVENALGLKRPGFKPDIDSNGKEYVWNKPGADLVYRLQLSMEAVRPLLAVVGEIEKSRLATDRNFQQLFKDANKVAKDKILKDIEERYAVLMEKLHSPENAITEKDDLSGWNGESVELPNGEKMTHYFKNKVDIYDAANLLESITNSINLKQDLNKTIEESRTYEDYSPSPLSRAVENMRFITRYDEGNLLRVAGKDKEISDKIKSFGKVPKNIGENLQKDFKDCDRAAKFYINSSITLKADIQKEYLNSNVRYVGPAPKVEMVKPKKEAEKEQQKEPKKDPEKEPEKKPEKEKNTRKINVLNSDKTIKILDETFDYESFKKAMINSGLKENAANAIFNLYTDDMLPYVFPLTESGVSRETRILALRGVVNYAQGVKGRTMNESLSLLNSVIFTETRLWENEHGMSFHQYQKKAKEKDIVNHKISDTYKKPSSKDGKGVDDTLGEKEGENKGDDIDDKDKDRDKENEKKGDNKEGEKEGEKKGDDKDGEKEGEKEGDDKAGGKEGENKGDDKKDEIDTSDFEIVEDYKGALLSSRSSTKKLSSKALEMLNNEASVFTPGDELAQYNKNGDDLLFNKIFKNEEEKAHMKEVYRNIGLSPNGIIEIRAYFILWAMSECDISFKNAIELLNGKDEKLDKDTLTLFIQFCEDNQILNNKEHPDKYRSAVTNWTKVLKKATDKLKDYKIPDIDFMNDEQFKACRNEIYWLNNIGVNLNQDFTLSIIEDSKSTHAYGADVAMAAVGGEKNLYDMTSFWHKLQGLTGEFQSATINNKDRKAFFEGEVENVKSAVAEKAVFDCAFRTKIQPLRGLKLSEALDQVKNTAIISQNATRMLTTVDDQDNIPFNKVLDYKTGKNRKPFIDEYKKIIKRYEARVKDNLAENMTDGIYKIINQPEHTKSIADGFINASDDSKARVDFLQRQNELGLSNRGWMVKEFRRISNEFFTNFYADTNLDISDMFLIDGVSPKKLWADKYSDVNNDEKKEWLIRSDILKEIYKGERNIQLLRYKFGPDNKLIQKGSVTLIPGKESMKRLMDGCELYNQFVSDTMLELQTIKEQLLETQENKKANFDGVEEEGSIAYRDMTRDLNDLMEDLENSKTKNVPYQGTKLKYAAFIKSARNYLKKVKGSEAARELKVNDALKVCQTSERALDKIMLMLSQDIMIGGDGKSLLEDISFHNANNSAKRFKNFYGKHLEIKTLSEDEITKKYNDMKGGDALEKMVIDAIKIAIDSGNQLGNESIDQLDKYADLYITAGALENINDSANEKLVPDQQAEDYAKIVRIYNNVGFQGNQPNMVQSMFILWAMGEKGYSFENAKNLLIGNAGDELRDEFLEFCEKTPIRNVDDAMSFEFNLNQWASIMKKATDKMKAYAIPDINYYNIDDVKNYYRDFAKIRDLGKDFVEGFVQSFAKLAYVDADGNKIIQNEFGGEKSFKEAVNFWKGVQDLTEDYYSAHVEPGGKDNIYEATTQELGKNIVSIATNDIMFRRKFTRVKGKKLGEIAIKEKALNQAITTGTKEFLEKVQNDEISIDPKMGIDYLTKTKQYDFSTVIDNLTKTEFPKAVTSLDFAYKGGMDIFYNMEMVDGLSEALINTGDHVKGMKQFLEKEAGEGIGVSNETWIRRQFDKLFQPEMYVAASDLNMDVNDFILIDGKTPNELWGEKYEKGVSAEEKELCLRAEVLKAFFKGESKIRLQIPKVGRDFKYQIGETVNIGPGKEYLEMLQKNSLKYEAAVSQLNNNLDGYYDRIRNTQSDPDNNFAGFVREGSRPYQEMCRALYEARKELKKAAKGENSPFEVKKALEEFQKKAQAYYKRGKTSKPERLNVASDSQLDVANYINAISGVIKVFDEDILVKSTGVKAKTATFKEIKEYGDKLIEKYDEFAPINKVEKALAEQELAHDIIIGSAQKNFDDNLAEVAGKMPNTGKKMSTSEVAKLVVYKNYKKSCRQPGITVERINQLATEVTAENFNREVNELTNNRIFRSIAEKYQNKTRSKWNEIKAKTDALHNRYQNFVDNKRGKAGLKFVTNIELTTKKEVRDKYDKFGEIVAKQILSTPRNNQLVQGVAAGLIDYNDIQKACTDYFRSKNTLEPKNFDPDEFVEKLDNGSFKNEAIAKITEPIQKSAERKAKQQLSQQKEKDKENNKDNKLEGFKK